jgi:hypothetical protein
MSATDLFQVRMIHPFANMGNRWQCPHIDDIFHFKGETFDKHQLILNKILKLLAKSGMQVSANKSCFCQELLEYLGFQLNHTDYKPLTSTVDDILSINPPKNIKQVCGFLRMINFIKNHIPKRTEICKPITRLKHKYIIFFWGGGNNRRHSIKSRLLSQR